MKYIDYKAFFIWMVGSLMLEFIFFICRTTVFSHSQTVVVCGNCQTVLCQPTGGKVRLTEGCSFRKKGD
jgi:small subunit ribosomal protein S27e